MTQWFYPGQEDYINKLNDLAAIADLSVGPKGDTGDTGPTGLSAYGEALANGFIGTDAEWLASLVGPKGDTGDTGPKGDTGDTGPKGDTGDTGNSGPSAYAAAVANGFVGTEAEWLASLVGPAGPSGASSWDDISGKPTLGTVAALNAPSSGDAGSTEVVKGNDTRLTDSRSPSGGAGGVLSGSYPNPGFAVDMATQGELDALAMTVSTKQNTLVSGTNIKTINGNELPGSGDVAVGYLNIPQNSKSAAYTLVLADAGKHIFHPSADTTARTFTIPANASVAYPIGTAITFVNQNGTGGVVSIAITSDTMRLAGAGTTGTRTLARNGVATAIKITTTEWIISGTGLT